MLGSRVISTFLLAQLLQNFYLCGLENLPELLIQFGQSC